MENPQWRIEYDAWVAEWRLTHPLPPMTKYERWKIEHAA
jgi:hypothetical protein